MLWGIEMGLIVALAVIGYRVQAIHWDDSHISSESLLRSIKMWIWPRMLPSGYESWLSRRLSAAGNPKGLSIDKLYFRQLILALIFLVAGLVLPLRGGVWITVLLPALGFLLPIYQLQSPIRKRERTIRRDVRNSLSCLIPLLEGELHYQTTLFEWFRRLQGPVGEAGRNVIAQVNGGRPLREALREEARRVQIPEFVQLSRVLMDGDRYGPQEMAGKLRELKSRMDREFKRKAKKEIRDALVRLFFVVLLFIFVPIVVLGFTIMLQSLKQNIPL